MGKVSKITTGICVALMAVFASGCASQAKQPAPIHETQAFVDGKMYRTISSIDQSLDTLVLLTRGGEPTRKDPPIGETVAGAAGDKRPAHTPQPTPKEVKIAKIKAEQAASVLNREVEIRWNGSAEELLKSLSEQLGFSFSAGKDPVTKSVSLQGEKMTVQEVLISVSKQLEGHADILVSLPNESLALIKR